MEILPGKDFQQVDPIEFLQYFYESPPTLELRVGYNFILDTLHEIFSRDSIRGQSLLDIGTGPCLHTIVSACNSVKDIYLTDYSDKSIEFLKQWWKGERVIQQELIQYVLDKENQKETFENRNSILKQKVKDIVNMDITSPAPLQDLNIPTGYDVITSGFCLQMACQNVEQYIDCFKYIFSLLNNGGYLILVGDLSNPEIKFGESTIKPLLMHRIDVQRIAETTGFVLVDWKELLQSSSDENFTGNSIFVMTGRKP